MRVDLAIHYVCPVNDRPGDFGQGSLMGFTAGVMELPERILACLRCPPHLHSIANSSETIAKFKLAGAFEHCIRPLNIDLLSSIEAHAENPLFVILSARDQDNLVSQILKGAAFPILHFRGEDVEKINNEEGFAEGKIREHIKVVARFLALKHSRVASVLLAALDQTKEVMPTRESSLARRDHGVTLPNELPLELAGYTFAESNRLCSNKEDDYVNAITMSANALAQERRRLEAGMTEYSDFKGPTVDLVLACPGLMQPLWSGSKLRKKSKRPDSNQYSGLGSTDEVARVVAFCTRQEGYTTMTSDTELNDLNKIPAFHLFMELVVKETRMFVACLTLQSTNDFCPVIRLPRRLNRSRGALGELGAFVRRTDRHDRTKLSRLARRVVDEISRSIPVDFLPFFDRDDMNLRIVADVPVEWVRADGIPLALRHFTSRMLATPGNLLSIQSIRTERCYIRLDRVTRIPVIRALRQGDRLRHVLEECFRTYAGEDGWRLEFDIIDVANEFDFVAALNSIDSPFVIFDGHGTHSKDTEVGGIVIDDHVLDVWALRGKVRVPPIVLLSACDTTPIDRSHASTANGFLALGAITVLGTLLPVHGIKSGLMMARLVYRLTSVAALWLKTYKVPLSWARIVGAQIRASYVSELLLQLVEDKVIAENEYLSLNVTITDAINRFSSNWITIFREQIQKVVRWNSEELERYLNHHFYLPDALKYVQLGAPEKVLFITAEIEGKLSEA